MAYWEDRITKEQATAMGEAVRKFKKGRKSRNAEHVLYDALTNNGMYPEEADDYINLLMEDV